MDLLNIGTTIYFFGVCLAGHGTVPFYECGLVWRTNNLEFDKNFGAPKRDCSLNSPQRVKGEKTKVIRFVGFRREESLKRCTPVAARALHRRITQRSALLMRAVTSSASASRGREPTVDPTALSCLSRWQSIDRVGTTPGAHAHLSPLFFR